MNLLCRFGFHNWQILERWAQTFQTNSAQFQVWSICVRCGKFNKLAEIDLQLSSQPPMGQRMPTD